MEWTNYVNDTTAAGVRLEQQRVGTDRRVDPLDEVISQTPFENKKPLPLSPSRSAVRAGEEGFPLRQRRLRLPLRVGSRLAALAAVRGQSRPDDGLGRGPALRHLRRLQESRPGLVTRGAR